MTERSRMVLALAVVMFSASAVYLNSLGNGFALDDLGIIQNNEQVHGVERLLDAVTGPYWPEGRAEAGLYRPLTQATYAVNWDIGGGDPFSFHLVNLLLHAAVSALVLILLLALGSPLVGATSGALLFAVHPVHVEAVANVVGRAEVLTTLFFVSACLLYVRGLENEGEAPRLGWSRAGAIALLYLLALASKENGITLPGVLLLAHVYRQRKISPAAMEALRQWRTYAALAGALVLYFVARKVNIGVFLGTEIPAWYYGMPDHVRILTAIRVWPEYLRLMLVPVDLVPDYGPGVIVPETDPFGPLVLLGLLTGSLLLYLAWRVRRTASLITAGILWFCVTVLPVTGLLFPVGIILAERTLYLPSVAVAMAAVPIVGWVRSHLTGQRKVVKASAFIVFAAVLGLAGLRTWTANPVWRDTPSVLDHLMESHPANYRGQWWLADRLLAQGDTAAALDHFELATRMVPGYVALRSQYGLALHATGQPAAAVAQFDTALQVIPEEPTLLQYRGASLIEADEPEDAAETATAGAALYPDEPGFPHLLARALARSGDFEGAIRARQEALSMFGDVQRARQWGHLAGVAVLTGDMDLAAAAMDSANLRDLAGRQLETPSALRSAIAEHGPEKIVPLW